MREQILHEGFYWLPLGGNNLDQISGHCYFYSDVSVAHHQTFITSVLIDLGKFDNHQALGIKNSMAAVPDIRAILKSEFSPKALFLTHSHPDHLNGIVHYLKAGFKLPPIYAGKYTFMILYDLLREFNVPKSLWPPFKTIKVGDVLNIGSIKLEVLPASHTCFDSFGFIISNGKICVYHTGDMKLDQTTCFRPSTDVKRFKAFLIKRKRKKL